MVPPEQFLSIRCVSCRMQRYFTMMKRPIELKNQLMQQIKNGPAASIPTPPPVSTPPVVATTRSCAGNGASIRHREKYIDRSLTQRELDFLYRTSTINGTRYLPWNESDAFDFKETQPFKDDYDYHLSEKHLKHGCYFEYPENMFRKPEVIKGSLDPLAIQQVGIFP